MNEEFNHGVHGEENGEISLTEARRHGVVVCFIIVLTTKIL